MRGRETKQSSMLCLMSPEGMVPERHPARRIRKMADECLAAMSSTFDAMYPARVGHLFRRSGS
jgi:hypothetical protein